MRSYPLPPARIVCSPDTPARLAVENRGMASVLDAAEDGLLVLATLMGDLWPSATTMLVTRDGGVAVEAVNPTIQN